MLLGIVICMNERVENLSIPDRKVYDKAMKIGKRIGEKEEAYRVKESKAVKNSIDNDRLIQHAYMRKIGLGDLLGWKTS